MAEATPKDIEVAHQFQFDFSDGKIVHKCFNNMWHKKNFSNVKKSGGGSYYTAATYLSIKNIYIVTHCMEVLDQNLNQLKLFLFSFESSLNMFF